MLQLHHRRHRRHHYLFLLLFLLLSLPTALPRPLGRSPSHLTTGSFEGFLKGRPLRVHSAAVQIHARSTGAQQETLDEWLVSLGTSPPAPPPPPPPFITLSLADLDCRNAYVHGLRSFVSRGSGQSAVFEEERPPSFTLAFDDGGIHCTLGRLEVHDGPLPDGREPSLLLHMTEGTVGMLSQLSMLSPISSLDISASGISGEFAFSLNPRGASGLPAGIRMPVSVVSIPPGGLAVTLTTGNEWADAIMKGAVTLIETLVSQVRRHSARAARTDPDAHRTIPTIVPGIHTAFEARRVLSMVCIAMSDLG